MNTQDCSDVRLFSVLGTESRSYVCKASALPLTYISDKDIIKAILLKLGSEKWKNCTEGGWEGRREGWMRRKKGKKEM